MKPEGDEIRKFLRQLFLIRIILFLSFLVAVGTTALVVVPSLFQTSGYGTLVPGPPASEAGQGTFTNITASFSSTPTASQTTYLTTTTASTTLRASTNSQQALVLQPVAGLFNYVGLTALISWTVFGAALIWRGHVRSVWGRSSFSYDTFRLLVRMRGAQTRLRLMRSLDSPKNKLQLATALGIDWKAVDKHVQVLEKNAIIKPTSTSGTSKFYEVTEKGKRLMQLLDELGVDLPSG